MFFLIALSRWLHVVSACLALGGVFFLLVIVPLALKTVNEPDRTRAGLSARRAFKMVVHSCILLLLLTGTFNTLMAWHKYELNPAVLHPLWGTHLLLGLAAMSVALYLLAGAEPPASYRKLLAVTLGLLLLAVAVASTLKSAGDRELARSAASHSVLEHP